MIKIGAIIVLAGAIGGYFIKQKTAKPVEEEQVTQMNAPAFNADSAYTYIAEQCNFGPRTMNSEAHEQCAQWIVNKFKSFGCTVSEQKAMLKGYDGTPLKATNIMAQLNPNATTRILLCAHWDSRPWADNDPNKDNWKKPVMAADDGASGVAVMLELARSLKSHNLGNIGIDFVCFDAEDWGTPEWIEKTNDEDTWALGAQYWSKNLPNNYTARYGILLDMVGGKNAKFYIEQASMAYAPEIVAKVWGEAANAGYSNVFINQTGGAITDDHIPVNQIAKIPTIDIIPYYPEMSPNVFGPVWHTVNDNIDNIDRKTLKAVGQTVMNVLCQEKE